jgi:stage V sporulation protein R
VRDPDAEEKATEIPRLKAKDYMESFINPEEYLEEQRQKIEAEKEREKKFPARPERDVLQFLMEHGPLERWERDILEIIREEALYFVPQMQTKVMNEGWACITGNHYVFTGHGLLTMQALVEGESSIVSDGGVPQHVYDRNIIKDHPTIRIRTRRGFELEGSTNHRVLLPDCETWKRLDQLNVGDRVCIGGGAGLWPTEVVDIDWNPKDAIVPQEIPPTVASTATELATGGLATVSAQPIRTAVRGARSTTFAIGNRTPVKIPRSMDEQLAAFLGYLVGDGHISRVKRVFGLTTGDAEQAHAFTALAERLFGLKARIKQDGGRMRVLLHSKTVSDFLVDRLGLTHGPSARVKKIPAAVLRSPKTVVSAFLRAYFDCDGYAGESGVILSTSSPVLAEQVQLLMLNFGILSRKRLAADGCWRVQIQGETVKAFNFNIGFGLTRKRQAAEAYVNDHHWFKKEAWEDEVVSIEHSRADVYDISVRETHRYAAAGFINHNSYWHSKLMTTKVLDASEIIDYADNNAGVMATSGGRLNPYKLGVELFRNVEERWNKGQFGKEWEDCDDLDAKKNWNLRLGLGKKKIFEVRSLYNDVTFIDEFLTADFCRDQKLFSFSWSNRNERYEIETREFKQVKEKLLFQLTNAGNPFIYVEDANYDNRGELLLKHDHQGLDLRADYAREVMKSLVRVWKRPVNLLTIVEGKQVMVRFDGREHSTRHMRQ